VTFFLGKLDPPHKWTFRPILGRSLGAMDRGGGICVYTHIHTHTIHRFKQNGLKLFFFSPLTKKRFCAKKGFPSKFFPIQVFLGENLEIFFRNYFLCSNFTNRQERQNCKFNVCYLAHRLCLCSICSWMHAQEELHRGVFFCVFVFFCPFFVWFWPC